MIKRFHKRQQEEKKFYRINERINALQLRVIDATGKQIGVLSKSEALALAKEQEIDLVEIVPHAKPPIVKLVDFNKFLYQEEKKKREEKKKTKVSETKEVRLGPFMEEHDLSVMTKRARGFLEDGDKVRFVVKFAGRQITHPEFGYQVLRRVMDNLSDIAKIEKDPKLEGKQLITIVSIERKQHGKDKN